MYLTTSRSSQCFTTGVTEAVVCTVYIKKSLAVNQKIVAHVVAVMGFLPLWLSEWSSTTLMMSDGINKMCRVCRYFFLFLPNLFNKALNIFY